MKTKSLEKNNSKILAANNRFVRHDGKRYLIRCQKLGSFVLADAELIPSSNEKPINLFDRNVLSKNLRDLVEKGCFS